MKKIISIFVTLCFCNLMIADIYSAIVGVNNVPLPNTVTATNNSLLPADIGKVVQDTYILGDTTIINIQDLHSDINTQKNIVSILEFFVNNYNVRNIYFEGAIGNLDFGWLNSIKDKKIKKNVADKLLSDGKITGAEYFGFFNKKKDILFKGLEEEKIYKENFIILEKMYEERAAIQQKMKYIADKLKQVSSEIFNYKLSFIDDLVTDYNNKNISQEQYYSYSFKLLGNNVDMKIDYSTINNFLKFGKELASLNKSKLEKEIIEINKKLKENLSYEKYYSLKEMFVKYPNQYYNELLKFISDYNFEKNSVEFIKFTNYLKHQNSIDVISLLQEEKKLTDMLYDKAAKTVREKDLAFLKSYTYKLLLFFTNTLPSFEYEYVKENFNKYCVLLENYISNTDITEIKQWYRFVDKFYSNNEKRNLFFLENILKKKISKKDFVNNFVVKNNERKSFEEILQYTKQPVEIMITGGYHSQGLKSLMAKLNINYAVVMPNVRLANPKNSEDKFYKDYLKQYSILSNTYQKFIRSSVMNTVWDDPVKVMIGTFFDYTVLQELFENLKKTEEVTSILKIIQQYLTDILKTKGMTVNQEITNIERINNNFVITVLTDGRERLFYISKDIVGEIYSKDDISKIEKEVKELNFQEQKKENSKNKILKKISRYMTIIFILPVLAVMGGGGVPFLQKREYKQPQPKKGLTNSGSKLNVTNQDYVEYIDTVINEGAQVSLDGKIKLDNVFIGKDDKFTIKAGENTYIKVRNIDMSNIGELDITIEDNGEYEVVSEEGVIKVYKVLRTDFSVSTKKRTELVSVLKQGSLFLPKESDWLMKNKYPIVIFYNNYGSWSKDNLMQKRTDMLYKDNEVIYIDLSDVTAYNGSIDNDKLITVLKRKKLQDKQICLDFSLIEERFAKPLGNLSSFWAEQTKGITYLNTHIPLSFFVKSNFHFNRENKHFYLNDDGTYKRYPYKDRNWLKSVLEKYLPSFKEKTFVFVWPVESVKYTYFTPKFADGGAPEQRISAFEPFKQFMDKARQYSADGKDSIVFMPGYLITELSMYLNNPDIGSSFADITYGDLEEANTFNIWYKKQDAKEIEKIELLKLENLTIVMYPEGNRGHNEQAYLKTLMATYTFGKESFDGMLTQAGYVWKANTVYVYEGNEMENLDMEAQLLKNPSIKTGKVSYVYENLKRVFIDLYSNMGRFFKKILPKFTKGNWISVENVVRDTMDITEIKEIVTAKSKLGFDSIAIIPVKENLLNEEDYGVPIILEQNGIKIPVYSVIFENSKIYFVGVENQNILWQDCVLSYIKDFLKEYRGNIISFYGKPQISVKRTNFLFPESFYPVVLNSDSKLNEQIEALGYDDIIDTSNILSRLRNSQLKYPHVASDMKEISETITVIKALKRKSFLGQFSKYKTSYVGVKIASDEHIFNNEMEENEFIEILKGTDIDFVTVVIRDNDLGVHVLNRETTVKENLIKLSKNLHEANKEIVLEYTFRFVDEFFKTFVRTIQEDCKDMGIDGIKLDLADCSVEDISKIIDDLKSIRQSMPNLKISLQVSNSVWEKYLSFFEELYIKRTVSSKEELLVGEHDLSADTDVNYEISIYKNQQEYEEKVFNLSNQRDRLLDKDPESVSSSLKPLLELGEEKFADQIIDNRLESIFQKVVLNDSIGRLILPVNMLYAQRLKNNENSNVIQAVSNLIRLFKENKGMNERRRFAYEYGLQQNIKLTDAQEEEIAKLLRGEGTASAASYVSKNFPYIFDYFIESRQTRIEISDSFLFGVYEANIARKYKEGQFGKVLKFIVDDNVSFDTQKEADERQELFYRALAQICLYKDIENIQNVFSLGNDEYKFYKGENFKQNYLNLLMGELQKRDRIYNGMTVFQKGFPLLTKIVTGYMPNRKDTLYEARILMKALLMAYKTQEIEPVLPEFVEDELHIEEMFINEDINSGINNLLASA